MDILNYDKRNKCENFDVHTCLMLSLEQGARIHRYIYRNEFIVTSIGLSKLGLLVLSKKLPKVTTLLGQHSSISAASLRQAVFRKQAACPMARNRKHYTPRAFWH
jgi:hypothetical protein